MISIEKTRPESSVWVFGRHDCAGILSASYETLMAVGVSSFAIYSDNPRTLTHIELSDERLAAIFCPTPSPFSHDANLLRAIAADKSISIVLGSAVPACAGSAWSTFSISATKKEVVLDEQILPIKDGVGGSDEALGLHLSKNCISYRPMYLYDDWLGSLIAEGLQRGISSFVSNRDCRSVLDADGRVWLHDGPRPSALARWIVTNSELYLKLLIELLHALRTLAMTRWAPQALLDSPDFLAAFAVNTKIAPLVGFPLFSLTRLAHQAADKTAMEIVMAESAAAIPVDERTTGRVSEATLAGALNHLESLRAQCEGRSDVVAVTSAAVLMSDVRRMVIDQLRRDYTPFRDHTKHRKLR